MVKRKDGSKLMGKKKFGKMLVNKNKKKLKVCVGKQKGCVSSEITLDGNVQDKFQWSETDIAKKNNGSKLDMKKKNKSKASSGKQKRTVTFVTTSHSLSGHDKDKFQPRVPMMVSRKSGSKLNVQNKKKLKMNLGKQDVAVPFDTTLDLLEENDQNRVPKMVVTKSGSKLNLQNKKKLKVNFGKQNVAVSSDTTLDLLEENDQNRFQSRVAKMVKRLSSSKLGVKNKKELKVNAVKQKRAATSDTELHPLGGNDKDEVELRLEERVFGGAANMIGRLASDDDGAGNSGAESDEGRAGALKRKPVWQDEDDEISAKEVFRAQGRRPTIIERVSGGYTEMLRQTFEYVVGDPKWADLKNKTEEGGDADAESDEELLQHCGKFIVKNEHMLNDRTIDIKRLRDLNTKLYAEGPVIKAVEFHPSAMVGLVAGLSGIASLFQVDGTNNAKLHSMKFEAFPIMCARFTRDGNNFMVGSGHHQHFFCHDLLTGKNSRIVLPSHNMHGNTRTFEMSPDGQLMAICDKLGQVNIMTVKSQEVVATLKINGHVTDIAFNSEGSRLFLHSNFGEVHVWDVSSRSFLHRFMDDGCIMGTSIAVSPNNQFLVCGSISGFVNLYETTTAMSSANPRPLKAFPNLTTAVSALKFDSSSQLLAMCSSNKECAIKIAHISSLCVYRNYPSMYSKVFRAQCFDFSPNSGFFTVGNNRNAALLYRLKSFANY